MRDKRAYIWYAVHILVVAMLFKINSKLDKITDGGE
tara:strand:+ start:106 stop:213 length:108 start_codon:yes stop_codon:yes gene_type:complete